MAVLMLAAMLFYVNAPDVEMRERPTVDSEVVSHTFFSEKVELIKEEGDWVLIQTAVDHYPGWVQRETLCERETVFPATEKQVFVNEPKVHVYKKATVTYGPMMTLPMESALEVLDDAVDSEGRWLRVRLPDQREAYIQSGDVIAQYPTMTWQELASFSMAFQGLPYTWGGRSSFGYDCSGFVQMLYRRMGIFLPRDAKDQFAWEGFSEILESQLRVGDIVFFGVDKDHIDHVGMILGINDLFIHSTVGENQPRVRISQLSDREWNGFGTYPYRTFRRLNI